MENDLVFLNKILYASPQGHWTFFSGSYIKLKINLIYVSVHKKIVSLNRFWVEWD